MTPGGNLLTSILVPGIENLVKGFDIAHAK